MSATGISHLTGLIVQNFIQESAADGVIAHAGGGQAGATALPLQMNRVTTVASAGDSVSLPPSAPGLEIEVMNAGANAMQVYGLGTDTINGVAAATGISQPPNSACLYFCTTAGVWTCSNPGSGFSGQLPTSSAVNSLTAHAGGGQGSATPLTAVINRVTTVGSANDSVLLPASAPGLQIIVVNAAASNSMNVFPATGEMINALSANAAFAVAAGKTVTFYCSNSGQWHSILSA